MAGTFPIQRARQELGFTPSTAVRANIDTRTGAGAVGVAIAEAGLAVAGELQRLDIKSDLKEANSQLSKYQRDVGLDNVERDAEVAAELDPEKHAAIFQKHAEAQKVFLPTNERGLAAAGLWNNKQAVVNAKLLASGMETRAEDNWLAEAGAKIVSISQTGSQEQLDEFKRFLVRRQSFEPLDKTDAAKLLMAASRAQIEGELSILKKQGVAGEPEKFNEATELIQSTNIFTSQESLAELRSVDMLRDFTIRKTQDLKAVRNLQINEDFVSKVLGSNLLPDEIQSSTLPDKTGITEGNVLSKKDWMEFAAASYDPAPPESTFDGIGDVLAAVIDFSQLRLSREGAYKEILNLRYIDRAITDARFQWAANKINNPYPRQVIADIQAVTENNNTAFKNKGFNAFFPKKDKGKAKDVNVELIAWIDSQLEKDKEPTREEMNQKAAELRAQTPSRIVEEVEENIPELSDEELIKRILK